MVKWRRLLTVSASAKLAGITTLCAMAPAVVRQIQRPSHEGFLWCMACVALSFFLFSFQVHEKSILLPAMPISLLCLRAPKLATAMPVLACVSMWPLLRKDGLGLAYLGCVVLFTSLFGGEDAPEKSKLALPASPKKKGVAAPGLDTLPG
jgi:alpha-1,3-glucosyltransferase